jgi:hypothetical protein
MPSAVIQKSGPAGLLERLATHTSIKTMDGQGKIATFVE